MHPAFFAGLFIVAVLSAAVQDAILGTFDLKQFLAYVCAYTLLLWLPPLIAKWLQKA